MKASDEQQLIISFIEKGDNVCTIATAGSGKSMSIIFLAQVVDTKKILHITYNAMLRKEFKEKVTSLGITNIDIHTYHSFAVKYFIANGYTDNGLRKIIRHQLLPIMPIPSYDIVVIDECQDMSPLYYHFIVYCLHQCKEKFQLIILGDPRQGIYEFRGSDSRFLTMAEDLWKGKHFLKSSIFHQCTLQMSYRVTNQMAEFINTCMIPDKNKVLLSCRDGEKVQYIRHSSYSSRKVVIHKIKEILLKGNKPGDIFILASSVKGKTIRKIENALSAINIPCYIPMTEVEKVDERVIDGKIVFSTFHTVKGRQRKFVFIVGFDDSYLKYYARNAPKTQCPNTLFVACTRATDVLYLLENNDSSFDKPLEFLTMNHYDMKECDFVEFTGLPQSIFYKDTTDDKTMIPYYKITPSELIKFIPESILDRIVPLLEQLFIEISSTPTLFMEEDIPTIIQFESGMYEDVSDLNGIAIPVMYYNRYRTNTLYQLMETMIHEMKDNEHLYLKQLFQEVDPICNDPSDYLYLSNMYVAMKERLYFKLKQIKRQEYQWLSQEVINKCVHLLDTYVLDTDIDPNEEKEQMLHEHTILDYVMEDEYSNIDKILDGCVDIPHAKYRFMARVDLITSDTIWELKCVSQLTTDHLLQVIIYAWLWRSLYPESMKKFKIINIKTGEVKELVSTFDELTFIVTLLLKSKYGTSTFMTDDEFQSLHSSCTLNV